MGRTKRFVAAAVGLLVASGIVSAQPEKAPQGAMDPAKQAAMEAMQKYGSPSEAHKTLEAFAGTWNYTVQFRMSPEGSVQTMGGTATNTIVFGGRFIKQEFHGKPDGDQPPFEGFGFIGYDNIRKEYQSVWIDNMATGMMTGIGQFDTATKSLTEQGSFSCPITMETSRKFRAKWRIVDPYNTIYESYMSSPDGKEFKAMEIHYNRAG